MTYTYDGLGRQTAMTDPLGNVTKYKYDALNRVISETAPNGGVTKYAYDNVGNLASSTDAMGNKTAYSYDENGNPIGMTDALGQAVALAYDKNSNATTAIQKNGGVLATTYDKVGRVVSETDANKHTTKYSYTKNGLVSQITDALGQKASFEYDALGNITKITAPGKAITLYEYDAAERALSSTDQLGFYKRGVEELVRIVIIVLSIFMLMVSASFNAPSPSLDTWKDVEEHESYQLWNERHDEFEKILHVIDGLNSEPKIYCFNLQAKGTDTVLLAHYSTTTENDVLNDNKLSEQIKQIMGEKSYGIMEMTDEGDDKVIFGCDETYSGFFCRLIYKPNHQMSTTTWV